MQGMAGPSGLPNNQQQISQLNLQQMQMQLQDPTNAAVRYLSAQVPGFTSLPMSQQLHHLNRMNVSDPRSLIYGN